MATQQEVDNIELPDNLSWVNNIELPDNLSWVNNIELPDNLWVDTDPLGLIPMDLSD